VLALRGLCKGFKGHLGLGHTPAVESLDLEIRRGEICGLLGPNGAGKTTTLKMVVGLLRPDAGQVQLFGLPPSDARTRARLGYLPENPYFYDHLTAEEFLDFYGQLRGLAPAERRARTARALARVGLEGRGRVALRKLSKGTVQRIGLAQAIQHDPELLILDEPMSGLDPIGRREVRDLILSLRAAGGSVLFSSHILQDAEMICDRVAILDRGRLRSAGRLDELVSRRVEWYEVTLRSSRPEALPGTVVTRNGEHCLMRVCDLEELGRLLAAAAEGSDEVTSVWPKRQTLEDLFLHEVRRPREVRS
jgi:ABC-2 type transport system ATP-binding protein